MYRKIVWCYVFILTLLDISLNTKLSAQGKSHGVTVHDSLIEGITFQEWGKDSVEEGASRGGGRGVSPGALALSPPALEFGRAALAAAHALTVTLTNTANTTMHLASVAGTTPDFHASFFESKTLPPQANTTFSVVYLGRREGPVSAHLYIHTSLGVHKYPVSAIGVASEWGVWPLVGVRVPLNATVEPLLTMHNPTDQTIQVSEVYSSGSWLGLALPDGAAAAPRAAWALPPGATRALVRLRLAPPPAAPHAPHSPHAAHAPLTAYVRIKANMTGGGLVVCVEARAAAAGEFASPLQLRLRARGSRDPAGRFDIALGNSAAAGVALDASVWAARCSAAPPAAPAPPHAGPAAHNGENRGAHNGNGAKSEGVYVSLSRTHLEPHEPLTHAAQLTFDYAKMWAGAGAGAQAAAGAEGAWCGGWVSLGRAAVPYSVRVLPGTLALTPPEMHFVTSSEEEALRPREVRVRNEFPVAVHVARVDFEPEVEQYFEVQQWGGTVAAGATAGVARVRLRPAALGEVVRAQIVMRTNVSDYALPLLVYSGRLDIEWQWPNSADGTLRLGALGASSTRRVAAWLHNGGVAPLCALELAAALAGATFHLPGCPEPQRGEEPASCRCVAAGARLAARLTLVAPARAGALAGRVWVRAARPGAWGVGTRSASCARRVELAALPGRLAARPLALQPAAPYAWSSAPLVLESTMAQSMRMVDVTLPPDNPALSYEAEGAEGAGEVSFGRHAVGRVVFAPERLCAPRCYTGLDPASPEGAAWERRGDWPDAAALRADAALQAERRARFEREAPRRNVSLYAHTTHVVQIPVWGAVGAQWPRLAASAGDAGLAGVGGAAPLRVRVRNPSRSHALLVQPVVDEPMALAETAVPAACRAESCRPARAAFRLLDWRATSGAVRTWRALAPAVPAGPAPANLSALATLLLAPDAELELRLSFAPLEPAPLTAYLYLRNNLTILEAVQLSGRGAYPSFEIGGRRPGTTSPLLFEVSECAEAGAGAGAAAGGSVRRTLLARNTGRVRVRLREWRVAGEPCGARGFRVAPCAALSLAPNESRPITISFTADWTLARVTATLSLRSELGRATFPLAAVAPARLLPRCAGAAPRPPWEAALRAAGCLAALAALALVLAAAALDAERELRRARAARPPPAARQPLDLRALASEPQAPPQPVPRRPPPRRRRPPRPPVDPAAERRAFERWRHDVLGTQDDDERSSEDNEQPKRSSTEDDTAPLLEAEVGDDPPAATDGYEADPETEDRPQGSGDDDAASTGSGSTTASSSSPVADVDEADDGDEHEDAPHERPPPESAESPTTPPRAPPADAAARPSRPRRDAADTPRRGDRSKTFDSGERSRPAVAKHHARKDKAGKRRERPAATPPRSPPPRAEPRGAGGAGGAVGAGGGGAGGALRWGASWSSVVAARAPAAQLAPIGSDVRRRAEPAPPDVSLFYFNGEHAPPAPLPAPREPDFAWRASPHAERPQYSPARDFLEEPGVGVGVGVGAAGAFAAPPLSSSVWGGALEPAAWLWGGSALAEPVRPPPGFGPARAARPYDPFRSLASIWAPGARDWRDPDAPDEPPH